MVLYQFVLFLLIFLLGGAVGSFLNVCIYRIPKGESIIHPPSHCPSCGRTLRIYDNIPVLSYLILKGRCRDCGWKIPLQYPLVEGMGGLFLLLLFLQFGWSLKVPIYFVFLSSLIAITFIDIREGIIPDLISLPILLLGLFLSPFTMGVWGALGGAAIGGGILLLIAVTYYYSCGREGMGGGDVKLLAMIGAFLGWKGVFFTLFVGSLLGSLTGVFLSLARGESIREVAIPFGPFLSAGAVFYLFIEGRWPFIGQ